MSHVVQPSPKRYSIAQRPGDNSLVQRAGGTALSQVVQPCPKWYSLVRRPGGTALSQVVQSCPQGVGHPCPKWYSPVHRGWPCARKYQATSATRSPPPSPLQPPLQRPGEGLSVAPRRASVQEHFSPAIQGPGSEDPVPTLTGGRRPQKPGVYKRRAGLHCPPGHRG